MMENANLRQFQEELNKVVNSHPEICWEAKSLCLQAESTRVAILANEAILKEVGSEVTENAESL